jgi:hypothetical protein
MHLRLLVLLVVGALFASVGCGAKAPTEKLVPVSGNITVNGKPLTVGTLSFRPIAEKGNTSPNEPGGTIDETGKYTIHTQGKEGAPPGWWKVIVSARDPIDPKDPYKPTKSHIPDKYELPNKTDLQVEVVETPGANAYDLKLTGKN